MEAHDTTTAPASSRKAGAGLRIGALLLALVLAFVAAVAVLVMIDVGDAGTAVNGFCKPGVTECYDFSESAKPFVLGAGWAGAVAAAVAALLGLAFAVRGRGGRHFAMAMGATFILLLLSVLIAQLG